jgi:hypothetical protein
MCTVERKNVFLHFFLLFSSFIFWSVNFFLSSVAVKNKNFGKQFRTLEKSFIFFSVVIYYTSDNFNRVEIIIFTITIILRNGSSVCYYNF